MLAIKPSVRTFLSTKKFSTECILYSYACSLGQQYKITFEHMHSAAGNDITELKEYMEELVTGRYFQINAEGNYIVLNPPYLEDTTELEMILIDRIQEYRSLFNIRSGWMGDKQACIKKMFKWLNTHKEYSFEDVLETAKHYISITDSKYTMRADYFIEKNSTSTLYAFAEDMKEGNVEDWTKTVL